MARATRFFAMVLYHSPAAFKRIQLTLREVYFSGVLSLVIIVVSGLFVGMVLGLQGYDTLNRYGAGESLGIFVVLSLVRELGPVVAGLLALVALSLVAGTTTSVLFAMREANQARIARDNADAAEGLAVQLSEALTKAQTEQTTAEKERGKAGQQCGQRCNYRPTSAEFVEEFGDGGCPLLSIEVEPVRNRLERSARKLLASRHLYSGIPRLESRPFVEGMLAGQQFMRDTR